MTDFEGIKRQISELAEKHNVTFTVIPALSNPYMGKSKDMSHFQFALANVEGAIDGFYSCGEAYPIEWAIKNRKSGFNILKAERYQARKCADYADALRAAKAAYRPPMVDVLVSIARDASVLEYATFTEWAHDVGYDDDSRKAERAYDACREHARALQKMFGADFDTLCELAAQL